MREIEFRAKGLYKDTWYYGNFVEYKRNLTYEIVDLDEDEMNLSHYVRRETLCQYTGLKDKNGKKIFEGDILEYEFEDIGKQKAYVNWNGKYSSFTLEVISEDFEYAPIESGAVIGNIYDNPELLEVEV